MTIQVYILSVILMILLPVAAAGLLRRRFKVPWLLFCAGILTFAASQVVHIPLNEWLGRLGLLPEQVNSGAVPLWRTALILGLTAGVCEELARAAGYALVKPWRNFEHGIMLGLGHGGIEAMIFGGVQTAAGFAALWALRGTDLSTLNLPADQLGALSLQMDVMTSSALAGFIPLIERILALGAQVFFSVMVLQAFRKKNAFFVLGAILYHALLDSAVVYMFYRWENVWLTYAVLILIMLPGMLWLISQARKQPAPPVRMKSSLVGELRVFWLAFQKEMLQQWRSRRVLVVGAVFILFGLGSPMLAKFTPELLKSVEGAEIFADLIPVPTIADAMGQYVKNLTQFGFILAILLGMGAVAAEKERGTIAMILSKPLPRWAFLTSKFAAQFVVYLLAFLVAGIGAYYYTYVLFGAPDAGRFLLMNVLLLAWLLTFVGVTLLGSVVGGSTGAAAGIGLGLSVALLISGSIPTIAPLMPGGLTAWAGALGSGVEAIPANAGALAMAGVIVLLSLLAALAVFERQEI